MESVCNMYLFVKQTIKLIMNPFVCGGFSFIISSDPLVSASLVHVS